jgi:hypothetical protein
MPSMTVEQLPQTFKSLTDRSQYRHCHITVSDVDGKLPAIELDKQYFYFFKVVEDLQRASSLSAKLEKQGDRVVITNIPKGIALWVLEPNAQPVPKKSVGLVEAKPQAPLAIDTTEQPPQSISQVNLTQPSEEQGQSLIDAPDHDPQINLLEKPISASQSTPMVEKREVENLLPFPILLETSRFSYCQIQVPDLDEQLAAISFEGLYYSFFRAIGSSQDLVSITRKLAQRGDQGVITSESGRYSIWVLEVDATVVAANP